MKRTDTNKMLFCVTGQLHLHRYMDHYCMNIIVLYSFVFVIFIFPFAYIVCLLIIYCLYSCPFFMPFHCAAVILQLSPS